MPRLAWVRPTLVTLLLAATACSSVQLSPQNPAGVDLSGSWMIDFGDSDSAAGLKDRKPPPVHSVRGRSSISREAIRITDGSGMAFVANDFQVLQADKMDIELNRDSMGVRYHPGVYRDVSWGERQRGLWEVYAGWEERDLVIISKARNLEVVETFHRTSPNRLTVHIAIEADGDKEEITRVFTRRP